MVILICKGGKEVIYTDMPTDVQFKYELRKKLTEENAKLEMLRNQEYDKLEKTLIQEIKVIEASLQD